MSFLISVIIPTYNRAYLIRETLDSILNQTYNDWECIVVDDGSTDNTFEILNEYLQKDSRFQYYQRPLNKSKGPNVCRNYGFEKSKGDFINWFDSDDLYLPNAFESFLKQFKDGTDIVVAKVVKIDSVTKNRIKENKILSNNLIEDYFVGRVTFYVCGPLWRRTFLDKQKKLFDENIFNLDDWDFNLMMLYQEPSIVYIDKPLIQYRIHGDSLSHEINKLNIEEIKSEFKAKNKHLKLLETNKLADPRVLQKYIRDRYRYILREALVQNDDKKFYYLRMLFISQLKILDFKGFIKTTFASTIFIVFNKGYKLLK